jgi:hypothetical protein
MRTAATALTCVSLLIVCACSLRVGPQVTYHLPGIVTAPFGFQATDRSIDFGRVFCATLTHLDPSHADWGQCQDYLHARVTEQPPPTDDIPAGWRVLIVGGIFSHCFEEQRVYAFEQGRQHLEMAHRIPTHLLTVGSVDAPERNAEQIAAYLKDHPGKYIAVGHSKGAVDLMVALHNHKVVRDNVAALVSVAGAISGSRLIDFGEKVTIAGFRKAVRESGLGNCRIEEAGGIDSMRRDKRNAFLRTWRPDPSLRTYSLVGVVEKKETSKPLHTMWELQSLYSIDQDSQMVAEEAIIPGATFLGAARGDHWALALPFSEHPNPDIRKKVDKNPFPRTALLEAIVRYVTSGA